MILKNFQAGFNYNGYSAKTMSGTDSYTNLQNIGSLNQAAHYGGGGSGYGVVIGAGDTPPTLDDYDLADSSIMANDKMKSLIASQSWSRDNGAVVTVQWLNNSNEAITVKEVGLSQKTASSSYAKNVNTIVARKVLDTPITIQPGETYAFTYSIRTT